MKLIIAVVFAALPIVTVAAEQGMEVSDLSLERCELREVIAREQAQSMLRKAAIAEHSLPLLRQLEAINSKATIPNKPIQDQLSADDIGKFSEMAQRLKSAQISDVIESRRERDFEVIEKMVMIADRNYRWKEQPAESDPDHIIYSALQSLRFMIKGNEITTPTSPVCTLDYALHSIESEAIVKSNSSHARFEQAVKQLRAILEKYGMKTLDRSQLTKKDLKTVNDLFGEVFNPMQQHSNFIQDIENIKLMTRAFDIMYESNKQDVAFSGGDGSAIGATLKKRTKTNEFTENMQIAIGLWVKINVKIPVEDLTNSTQ